MGDSKGYYVTEVRVKESATPVDDVTKFAYYDDDYEEMQAWHEYTEEELAQQQEAIEAAEKAEMLDMLPDAVAELSNAVSDNAVDLNDVSDALAELSLLVNDIMEVQNNG